jgi:hypothetical protein
MKRRPYWLVLIWVLAMAVPSAFGQVNDNRQGNHFIMPWAVNLPLPPAAPREKPTVEIVIDFQSDMKSFQLTGASARCDVTLRDPNHGGIEVILGRHAAAAFWGNTSRFPWCRCLELTVRAITRPERLFRTSAFCRAIS